MNELHETEQYIRLHYSRKYTTTLSLTDDNIIEALTLYADAIENHRSLYREIISHYGYRYRRMENFIKELGLWNPEKGWLHLYIITKVYIEYKYGTNPFKIEVILYHRIPEQFIGKHDLGKCEEFAYWVAENMGWYFAGVGEVKVGDDEKVDVSYTFCCTQKCKVQALLWKERGIGEARRFEIVDSGEFFIDYANYVLHSMKICSNVKDWQLLYYEEAEEYVED